METSLPDNLKYPTIDKYDRNTDPMSMLQFIQHKLACIHERMQFCVVLSQQP